MQDTKAFAPFYGVSQTSAAGGLISSVTVAATAAGATASGRFPDGPTNDNLQVQIANTSTSGFAFVNFGVIRDALTVPAATVAASFPVPPNTATVVSVDREVNGASVIMAAGLGAASVIFTKGAGV